MSSVAAPLKRIVRFLSPAGKVYYGEQTSAADKTATVLTGNLFDGSLKRTDTTEEIEELLAPLVPRDIFCIGVNYMKHYEESAKKVGIPLPKHPVLFMKPSGTLANPEQDVYMPNIEHGKTLDWECELTVVIGKTCRNIKKEEALDYVFGYCVGNDVTCRHWQRNAGANQWVKGKGFDTFCPIGPCIMTKEAIPDPQTLQLVTKVNGEIQQNENTSDMIFSVAEIIEFISSEMTLVPGSIIMTGTPSGVAIGRSPPNFLKVGDVVECEISSIGKIKNKIVASPSVSKL